MELHPNHTEDVIELLVELNLCEKTERDGEVLYKSHEKFKGSKHQYPAEIGEHCIPCNGYLFFNTKSSQNLQLCDVYMSSRYLAKYAMGIDKNSMVHVSDGKQKNTVEIYEEKLYNTKISSSAFHKQKKDMNRKDRDDPKGKVLALTEGIALSLEFQQVMTNINFVRVPIVAPEQRPEIYIWRDTNSNRDISEDPFQVYMSIIRSLNVGENRRFTEEQKDLLEDIQCSHMSTDSITLYGVRPPELFFINNPVDYLVWFSRCELVTKEKLEKYVVDDISLCHWIDGTNHRI